MNDRSKQINDTLSSLLKTSMGEKNLPRIQEAMKYALMGGGKRIRPMLCIASAEAIGSPYTGADIYNPDNIWVSACAIEVIHTYSLVHDDLPAMDDDRLRRGQPTCHVAFDEATAILTGDALLTLAFEWLSSLRITTGDEAKIQLNIIQILSKAAGFSGMIEGQMRDLASEKQKLSQEKLELMHRLKTGALIEASVYTGARLAGGNEKQIEQLRQYAHHIGLAFQIADDILNVEGNEAEMGKAVGTDSQRSKNTYPSILGLEKSKALSRIVVNKALKALEVFDNRSDPLRALAMYIIQRNH